MASMLFYCMLLSGSSVQRIMQYHRFLQETTALGTFQDCPRFTNTCKQALPEAMTESLSQAYKN